MSATLNLKPGEHEETLYIEPRTTFDACVLRLENGVAVYDGDKVIHTFQQQFLESLKEENIETNELYPDVTPEEQAWEMAQEWFDFNVAGAYLGEYTPKYEFKDFDEV
tara:strand:- start:9811 stop:10134 length:324 start_codon:yes stop_codon:yes gene_type:complete